MGVAALEILFFHFWQCVTTSMTSSVWGFLEHYLVGVTYQGVDLFLLISGMGMVYSIEKNPRVGQFYCRRIRRVWVPFLIVSVVLGIWLGWPLGEFLKNILGINFYISSIYSDMWYVTAILTFYLLFPLYFHFFRRAGSQRMFTILAIVIWYTLTAIFGKSMRWDFSGFTNRIPIFLLGIQLGWNLRHPGQRADLSDAHGDRRMLVTAGVILLISGNYFLYVTNFRGFSFGIPASNAFLGPLLTSCGLAILISDLAWKWHNGENEGETAQRIVHGAGAKDSGADKISNPLMRGVDRVLVFYGSLSLEVYLIQEFFMRIPQKLPETVPPLGRSWMYFIAITALAVLLKRLTGWLESFISI